MSSEPFARFDPAGPESRPDPWLDLADRVSSGEEIDFESLEAEVNDPAALALLRAMGTLSSIGQLHSREHLDATRHAALGDLEPSFADPEPDAPHWGPLLLGESLGHGATGEVFRAHDPRLQRDIALKLLHPHRAADPQWASAMLREGRALARVDHPHVVRVLGAEEHDGQWGLWMEFVEGESLEALLSRQGRFSGEEASFVGLAVTRALAAVHAAGIVHRDVKAQNVMRAEGGRVVLMDFGSSTALELEEGAGVSGTPLYMAPELFDGAVASIASDLYAVGVLLYHLVTGEFPVAATSAGALRQAHRDRAPVALGERRTDLSPDFVSVVESALDPDPAKRPGSAAAMAESLARASGRPPLAASPTRHRRPKWLAWGPALLIALLAGTFWLRNAAAPAEFDVQATLLRYGQQSVEELYSGATLELQQDLGLRFAASEPVHLYVIDQDAAGRSFVLFPLTGAELQNPLPAGVWELPGRVDGAEVAWTVTSEGGREQILLVASREPLPELEERLDGLARAGGGYAALSDADLLSLRGIGGLSPRTPADGGITESQQLLDEISELAGRSARSMQQQSREGVWIRRIVLRSGGD